eukprot:13371742-Heterocapsa_arctica.AAC.1
MEEEEQEDVQPLVWRWQTTEDSYVMANQNIYPTTGMATMIKVEDFMTTKERSLGVQYSMILS